MPELSPEAKNDLRQKFKEIILGIDFDNMLIEDLEEIASQVQIIQGEGTYDTTSNSTF